MIGVIVKIHSNFYYSKCDGFLFECKIREKLKKGKQEVFVGDSVLLEEIDKESNQAVIVEILKRTSFLPKPSIANISQVVVVSSITNPELNFTQLDRYLANAKRYRFNAVICINKTDLINDEEKIEKIKSIYAPLGYRLIFISAKSGQGIEEFTKVLENNISVLCGESGVGKSSILNSISPELQLRTKEISTKSNRGTHTTRHVELIDLSFKDGSCGTLADAPGFSFLKFDDIHPDSIDELFNEIYKLSHDCFYSDCLHLNENGCKVVENINHIPSSRYNSYKHLIEEALIYKKKIMETGHKEEKKSKLIDKGDNKKAEIVKVSIHQREDSRKKNRQKLKNIISSLDDAYYNERCLD